MEIDSFEPDDQSRRARNIHTIMLFGTTNVGKTVTGRLLAERLG